MILITISNDVNTNPGPSQSESNYPCGTCEKPVNWDDRGIVCDTCNQWHHVSWDERGIVCDTCNQWHHVSWDDRVTTRYNKGRTDNNSIPPFKSEGILHTESKDKANMLNSQFQKAFSSREDVTEKEFKDRYKMIGNFPNMPEITSQKMESPNYYSGTRQHNTFERTVF
ncbi:unnamed protein product [Mytilus coruscus]|uniref:Uncharacterized protein n=1 Tax=Mytilus coruscus TaxID=42192 RepID=A0A6J8CZB2_MYTCO|nr:unnamed protein product [Mytilus coruscus]